MKFISNQVEIEANQFFHGATGPIGVRTREDGSCYVVTIHGQETDIAPGDWIILEPGSDGTRAYPCKPEIFERRYTPEAATHTVPNRRSFDDELVCLLNKYSKENGSNTPDFILAEYLIRCLEGWNVAVRAREEWHGRSFSPGCLSHPLMPITLHEDGSIEKDGDGLAAAIRARGAK